jgi:hypothetical protein
MHYSRAAGFSPRQLGKLFLLMNLRPLGNNSYGVLNSKPAFVGNS